MRVFQSLMITQTYTVVVGLLLCNSLCLEQHDVDTKLKVVSSILLCAGVMTFVQAWIGVRSN